MRRGLRVHRRVKRRHQKRGGGSLARHVAECNDQPAILALDKVVIIAADLVTGKADALQFVAGNLRRGGRLIALLDFTRQLQLVL